MILITHEMQRQGFGGTAASTMAIDPWMWSVMRA